MSDELQRQLAEFLKFLLTQAQDATTFAKSQIPPLVAEKIRFGRVWHLVVTILSVAAAWRTIAIVKWCYRKLQDDDEGWAVGMVAFALVAVVLCGVTVDSLHDALLAWLAPRLYIVEWLTGLARNAKH